MPMTHLPEIGAENLGAICYRIFLLPVSVKMVTNGTCSIFVTVYGTSFCFLKKTSNSELWSLLTTNRKSYMDFSNNPLWTTKIQDGGQIVKIAISQRKITRL